MASLGEEEASTDVNLAEILLTANKPRFYQEETVFEVRKTRKQTGYA